MVLLDSEGPHFNLSGVGVDQEGGPGDKDINWGKALVPRCLAPVMTLVSQGMHNIQLSLVV